MSSDACRLAEHQSEAVDRIAWLLSEYGGAILADEPGLGKSFVAAEIARRHRDVELIVPAALVAQWQETLIRFGVVARVTTHDRIVNDHFVPDGRERLVIVDEAHAFRNSATQRYDGLARRTTGARLLLVTATPVCNSARDLESLIRLVAADDALARIGVASIDHSFETGDRAAIATIVSELVIRRDRDVLPDDLQFGELVRHVIRFDSGASRIVPLIDALRFPLVGDSAILRQFLLRRLESSDAALCESLRRQRRFYERALECLASGRAMPKREYRRAFSHEEDADAFQRVLFWELFVPAGESASASDLQDETRRIDEILSFAFSSQKRDALVRALDGNPALVFTGWAATAIDLYKHVRDSALVTGRNRRALSDGIAAFQRGRVKVLISTDLAAEGLNLQRAAVVVHYDIPWNPMKLEQRNGRAHRIGQRRDHVDAIYFLPDADDTGILNTMSRKNRIRRNVLRAHAVEPAPPPVGLRPRVQSTAAITKFAERVAVPDFAVRRHRQGMERLLRQLASEYLDDRKLRDLEDLLQLEPWARGSRIRLALL